MIATTKRRWFQFHLSTAVFAMLLAGVVVGKNTKLKSALCSTPIGGEHTMPAILNGTGREFPLQFRPMTTTVKLRWVQFHLSTAILAAVVAGGMMAANSKPYLVINDNEANQNIGWPFSMYQLDFEYLPDTFSKAELNKALHLHDRNYYLAGVGVIFPSIWGWHYNVLGIIGNAVAAVVLIFFNKVCIGIPLSMLQRLNPDHKATTYSRIQTGIRRRGQTKS